MTCKAYKFELQPTPKQAKKMAEACGATRWAYNLLLKRCNQEYEDFLINEGLLESPHKAWDLMTKDERKERNSKIIEANKERQKKEIKISTPTKISDGAFYNIIKNMRNSGEPEWLKDVYSGILSKSCSNLVRSFKNWWNPKLRAKHPKFKQKWKNDNFSVQVVKGSQKTAIQYRALKIPGIGKIRCKIENPLERVCGNPISISVSRECRDRWFASVTVKDWVGPKSVAPNKKVVGIDLGLNYLTLFSEGIEEKRYYPYPLKRNLIRLKRLQKSQKRKQKLSKRNEKSKKRVAQLHFKIANIRKDWQHKLTSNIIREYGTVVIEGFDIRDLVEKHVDKSKGKDYASIVRQKMLDIGWGEIRRQLEYKGSPEWHNRNILVVNDKTNLTCSSCACINSDKEKNKIFECKECGLKIERQLNSAKLLEKFGRGAL